MLAPPVADRLGADVKIVHDGGEASPGGQQVEDFAAELG
jgi:hypothetical protein